MKKAKIIGTIIGVLIFIIVVSGITYAYFTWRSNDVVISGSSKCFVIDYGVSQEIGAADISENISIGNSHRDGSYAEVTFNLDGNCSGAKALGTLYLNTNDVGTDAEVLTGALKYTVIKKTDITSRVVSDGVITSTDTITLLDDIELSAESQDYTYQVWVWIDSSLSDGSYIGSHYSGYISAEAEQVEEFIYNSSTDISNFTYALGSDSTTIDTINYYDENTDEYYDIPVTPINIASDEILLIRYTGASTEVNIPNTYTVDGITYNTVVLSSAYLIYGDNGEIDTDIGMFAYNTSITSVSFGENVKFISSDYYIDDPYGSAYFLFCSCTSLESVSLLPGSITYLDFAFDGCTNLTGEINIESSVVSSANSIFSNTSESIIVNVPDESTTYDTLNALTNDYDMPSNVTLVGI